MVNTLRTVPIGCRRIGEGCCGGDDAVGFEVVVIETVSVSVSV